MCLCLSRCRTVLLVIEGFSLLFSFVMTDEALSIRLIIHVVCQEVCVLCALLLMLLYRSRKPSGVLRHVSGIAFFIAIFYSLVVAAIAIPSILANDFSYLFAVLALSTLQAKHRGMRCGSSRFGHSFYMLQPPRRHPIHPSVKVSALVDAFSVPSLARRLRLFCLWSGSSGVTARCFGVVGSPSQRVQL